MKPYKKLFVLILLVIPLFQGWCQNYSNPSRKQSINISADELKTDVEFLSDTLLRGRGCGKQGSQEAAAYVARAFKRNGLKLSCQCYPDAGGRIGHNIIGELRCDHGSTEYLVVCAYYDGLGEIQGKVYPGADANASGLAALIALSGRLGWSGKNILFVALDGHNARLSGAYALKNFKASAGPGTKIGMVVNLDALGTSLAAPSKLHPEYLIALGGEKFYSSLNIANPNRSMRLYYDYYGSKSFTDMFYRKISDQAPFVAEGVPCVMFTSGITDHTNKVSDTAETLDYEMFATRVELIRRWLLNL